MEKLQSGINRHRVRRARGIADAPPDSDAISLCVRTVEIALRRGCRDEAVAAIDRLFVAVAKPVAITDESPVHLLGMRTRVANLLESAGVFTLGQLRPFIAGAWKLPNLGPTAVREAIEAIERADAAMAAASVVEVSAIPLDDGDEEDEDDCEFGDDDWSDDE